MTAPALLTSEASWTRCRPCGSLLYGKRLARNLYVCPECGHHLRLTARRRIEQLADEGSFVPLAVTARPVDPLEFTDSMPYEQRLAQARRETGLTEAVLCGTARIMGEPAVLAVMDFAFMGGSLGSAAGELITLAAESALERGLPFVVVTASGGARMQEGVLSLMQMAKTSHAIASLRKAGLLTISVITDPTYGGVAASYAANTDVMVAEEGARMGFAGPRVIEQTIGQKLPAGFQTAEFLMRHGQLDVVEGRHALPARLHALLACARGRGPLPAVEPVLIRDPAELPSKDAWDIVRAARDTGRPTTLDYLNGVFDSFTELHGDRVRGDCPAIVAGVARLDGMGVAVIGHQKGHTTKELVARNFGMAKPEGYHKAMRVMRLAADLRLPVITFVDTPGAYPGIEAEEGGQALAIARNVQEMGGLRTPVITVITGEGGSGGALALAVADRVLILQNATYSVITPEGCSSILWNTPSAAADAARALRISARDLLELGVVDGVVPEPPGGAQHDHHTQVANVRRALLETLPGLLELPTAELVPARRARFRQYGDSAALLDGVRHDRGRTA